MRWEHGAHGSISSDSVEDLGVTVLIDTRYTAGAGWRLPMTVIAPRTVTNGETLLANTTLSIGAASAVDVTLRFFAPSASETQPLEYDVNVSLLTGEFDGQFASPGTVSPVQFTGVVRPAPLPPSPAPSPCHPPPRTGSGPPVPGKTDGCMPDWHCNVCKLGTPDGSMGPSACLSCLPGYHFERRSADCTGVCTAPTSHVLQQTIPVDGVHGRYAQVLATVALGGKGVAVDDFTVAVTLSGGR